MGSVKKLGLEKYNFFLHDYCCIHVFASNTVSVTGKLILKTRDVGGSWVVPLTHGTSLNNHFFEPDILKFLSGLDC